MLSTVAHLANKPDGAVLFCLVFALVLGILGALAGAVSAVGRAHLGWAVGLASAGLAFFFAAFLVGG